MSFYLSAFVTSKNPEQTASVFINEQTVGNLSITVNEASSKEPKQFILKLPDARDNNYAIRFEIDNPVTPKSVGVNEDTRRLGFGFVSMELLPQ